MTQYEVTFIVDPVLSDNEISSTAKMYRESLQDEGAKIVHVDEMGLRQMAYPIKKRNSGVYYCIEFQTESRSVIDKLELALRRDEHIIRHLTVKLDKYGVKYNEDKRKGLIGRKKKTEEKKEEPKEAPRKERKAVSSKQKPAASAAVAETATATKAKTKSDEEE
jgi:small subunit ribosomal protein S6